MLIANLVAANMQVSIVLAFIIGSATVVIAGDLVCPTKSIVSTEQTPTIMFTKTHRLHCSRRDPLLRPTVCKINSPRQAKNIIPYRTGQGSYCIPWISGLRNASHNVSAWGKTGRYNSSDAHCYHTFFPSTTHPDLAKLVMSVMKCSESWASTGPGRGGEADSPTSPSLRPAPHSIPSSHPGS